MDGLFKHCVSLISLNLINFNITKICSYSDMFYEVNNNLVYCINNESGLIIESQLSNFKKNCSDFCFQNSSKLILDKNICIDDCEKDNIYKFEYNNICYSSCPYETHMASYNNNICKKDLIFYKYHDYNSTDCLDDIPEGYYLNNSDLKLIDKCNIKCGICSLESELNNLCITCNFKNDYYPKFNNISNSNYFIDCYNDLEGYYLYNNSFYQCYETCKKCSEKGNEEKHNCIECISNYTFINNIEKNTNCYFKCPYYYYFDLEQNYICTIDNNCPDDYNKLIIEEKRCVNNCSKELIYKYEYNNTCFNSCPNGTHNSSYNNNNYLCEDDFRCDKYYNYNYTACIEEIPYGFYLNDSNLRTIDKCDIKCGNCSLESVKNDLCISCNTNNNYYPKFNDSLNNNSYINCYNKSQLTEDYILVNNIFMKCFQTCHNCIEIGDEINH